MKLRDLVLRAAGLAVFVSSPITAAGQVVAGRVIDAASGAGVPEAHVMVIGRDRRDALTSADGRFSVRVGGAGSYRVRVARAGYQETRTRRLTLGPDDTVAVEVRVRTAAVRLDPLTATARPRRLTVTGVFGNEGYVGRAGPPSAGGARRSILVTGTIPAPTPCYTTAGAARRTGSVVTLNVEARPTGETAACPAMPLSFGYKATVRGLPPGSYTLQVVHTYRDRVWPPAMALDTTIIVQ